jgi:hypothetical protein
MSNLSDIGFPVRGDEEIYAMIQSVLPFVKMETCPQGIYYRFTDESGAEMYLQANHSQELIGFNPHFDGKSKRAVGLTKSFERESSELDGGYHAWANPTDKDASETTGEYPFVFDAPDFRTVGLTEFPQTLEIQLTAFASNEFQVFSSEQDYYDSQEDEIKMAAKSFIPSGMFLPDDEATPIEPPRPVGIFTGEIKELELKTNSVSKEKFYWFLVETLGGEVDVVADPKLLASEPKIGGIVSGQFWLSGRLIYPPEISENN